MTTTFARWQAAAFAAVLCAGPMAGSVAAEPALNSAKADENLVRADLSSGSLVVPVTVGGQVVEAVLDTGASVTVLDAAFARSLGVASTADVQVGGGGRTVAGGRGGPLPVTIGAETFTVRPVLMDLSRTGLTQKVIVGREFFDAFVVQIDFDAPAVRITPRGAFDDRADGLGALVPLARTSTAILSVTVNIDGVDHQAGLDLGSEVAIDVPAAAVAGRPQSTWVRADVSGVHVYPTTALGSLRLAGTELRDVPAFVVDHPQRPGRATLGLPVLRRFTTTLDLGGERMWLKPTASAGAPFPRDRLGLAWLREAGGLSVVHVAENSPAAAAGFAAGDMIVAVDGTEVRADNAARLARAGKAPAGTVVSLRTAVGVARTVTLADYY